MAEALHSGLVVVDKPAGWTSHDVVAKLRGVYGQRRIGHAGDAVDEALRLAVAFRGADRVFRRLEDVADRVRRGRVLLIVSPDSRIPPEEVQKFFDGLSQKNNLCVLTGDKTAMASVEKAAR